MAGILSCQLHNGEDIEPRLCPDGAFNFGSDASFTRHDL